MKLEQLLDIDNLNRLITEKYIAVRRHPSLPLRILNYTSSCMFEDKWPYEVVVCRGLIVDDQDNIISRPIPKFYNLGQTGTFIRDNSEGGRLIVKDETIDSNFLLRKSLAWQSPLTITRKLDGWCLLGNTKLNLWDGGTIKIRKIVNGKLNPILVGKDKDGNIVPCKVIDWFDNGKKYNWILVTVDCLVSRKAGCGRFSNNLPITEEQEAEINGVFQPIGNAKVGDKLTTYLSTPSSSVLKFIKASLLGDGSVLPHENSYHFSEAHKREHLDYVKMVSLWLGECGLKIYDAVSGFGSPMSRVDSKAYLSLKGLREEWYPNGTKVVPSDLSWVDDFVIAQWYMGDGSLSHSEFQRDRAAFATNCFLKRDVKRLALKLEKMYGVDCTVYNSKGWSIRINAGKSGEISKFWVAITPHVIPSMRYKIPNEYQDIKYIGYPYGIEERIPVEAKVLNVQKLDNPKSSYFGSGRKGFDIQTTTGNYFAKGVLVHNCGISWHYEDKWGVASRGSFDSPGAIYATEKFQKFVKYTATEFIPKDTTLFFEIISKVTRVVVPYNYEGLVLIAAIDNQTGGEMEYGDLETLHKSINQYAHDRPWCRLVERFDKSIEECAADDDKTEEGYVIAINRKDLPPIRAKIKLAEYNRLHRIICGVTPQKIWAEMASPMDPWLSHGSKKDWKTGEIKHDMLVPKEFSDWVLAWQNRMTECFHENLLESLQVLGKFRELSGAMDDHLLWDHLRTKFKDYQVKVAFQLYQGKVVEAYTTLWNLVRPHGREDAFYSEGRGE